MQLSAKYDVPDFHKSLLLHISRHTSGLIVVFEKETGKYVYVNADHQNIPDDTTADIKIGPDAFSFLKQLFPELSQHTIFDEVVKKGYWQRVMEYNTSKGKTFRGSIYIKPFHFDGSDLFFIQIEENLSGLNGDRLAGERQLYGAFIDYASIGIVIGNIYGQIVRINPFALQLFGYKEEEVIGKEIEVLIPSRFHEKHSGHRTRFVNRPQNRPMGTGMDLFASRKDGTEFPVEVSLGTYSMDGEKFVIAFVSDITIRKNAEMEIKKLNDELEFKVVERTRQLTEVLSQLESSESELKKLLEREKELGELKSRFVSMASHEFRTPLSTILSSAYLLEKYATTETQYKRVKHIERIISSVNMLTDILNDFLSVGKIEEGKIIVRPTSFNIRDVINQIIGDISNLLKSGQQIRYNHAGDKTVTTDLSLLKHVMLNLIANAVKFSPENTGIEVSTETGSDHFIVRVQDYGIGIAKEDQEHLFERFYRGANAVNIQGTGLGLHIVARYIELMGGTIECESELAKGTLFTVKVPMNEFPETCFE